ncbi:neuroglobin-like [Amblyraja radiata]|uniref:neuroglobin-like n=1 Tax=Amblyraja radiata TaxID=386614 RepID=UPI0014027323|nr:neuroglobin-like [Amblyraja radiata]
MGCALSGAGGEAGVLEPGEGSGPAEVPGLSGRQKQLLRASWDVLQQDIARVGVIMFIRLFETHPECKDVFFLFSDIDDLQQLKMSKELQSHGLRVMSFIEKSVARLDQEDKLEQLAFHLGCSHCRYNAPPKYYPYIGAQFIAVVKPILKEQWTAEVEDAWECLFNYLTSTMKRGYQEAEQRNKVHQAGYSARKTAAASTNRNVI